MSTTIDERVVQMRFDNRQFESATKESMSTLQRLKDSLNLTGASKGLENVSRAANKVDMRGLGGAIETVHAKFSALEVMGVTALANITNSAVNAGKRMVSALTIDPIKTGFQEYETQMNAVQTILANTSSKGSTIDDVNAALKELNTYADKTIYNFTEMTRNIGTFTAAGVDLDTSVSAIQGIANLAAVSGSTSQQASTAMYQLSQALATGTVKLQDWNSVVNAGMGGEVFQNALIRTAAAMDGAAGNVEAWRAANIDAFGSFRESLTQGAWLTTDVLTATLNQFTMAAEEGSEEWNKFKKELMEQGYTEAQANEILKMANTATDAATKVKTFTQLWDVMKESVQSGWAQTWQLLIGDFEEAKGLLTPLSDVITGFIGKMSDARNAVLGGALGKTFGKLSENLKLVEKPLGKVSGAMKAATDAAKNYEKVVDEIIGGAWGDGQERWNKLAKAGYDWAHAQNLVNEKLGDGTRHATNYKEAQSKVAETQKDSAKSAEKTTEAQAKQIEKLCKLSDEQLKNKGYTEEQIKAFKELEKSADELGLSVSDLILNADNLNGRWLLIDSFKNIGKGLISVFKSMGDAWKGIFPTTQEEQIQNLFDAITAFHRLSSKLVMSEETANKLTRTFKGLFAIIDIITTITGGGLKIAFKAVSALLSYFDMDLLSVTANMGDAIVGFRDWLDGILDFEKGFEVLIPLLKDGIGAIKGWGEAFMDLPEVQNTIEKIKDAFESLKDMNFKEFGKFIIEGLKNGLDGGISDVIESIKELAVGLIEKFCEVTGIASPAKEFIKIGKYIIEGLIEGLQNGFSAVTEILGNLASKIIDFFKNIDFGQLFAVGISIGILYTIKQVADAFKTLSGPLESITGILDAVEGVVSRFEKVVKNFAGVLGSVRNKINAEALKTFATSILILVGAIAVLTVLIKWDPKAVAIAVVAIIGIIASLVLVMREMNKLGTDGMKSVGKFVAFVWSIAGAIAVLAIVIKMLSGIKNYDQVLVGMGVIIGSLALLMGVSKLGDGKEIGKMLIQMAGALAILVIIMKILAGMKWSELEKSTVGMLSLVGVLSLLMVISKIGHFKKVGIMLMQIAGAMAILVLVTKLIATMEWEEMGKAAVGLLGLVGIVTLLALVTKIGGHNDVGKTIAGISFAMAALATAAKIMGSMEWGEMGKAAVGIVALAGIITGLIAATRLAGGNDLQRVGVTILAMAVAVGILAGVAVMLGLMPVENLVKGIVAVGLLSTFMALMVKSTAFVYDCKSNLVVLTVAIGIMAAAVAGLSFIDPKKLASATGALSALMGMFALMAKVTGSATYSAKSVLVLAVLAGIMAAMAGVILWLSTMKSDGMLEKAASLALLMGALSVVALILSKMNTDLANALKGAVALTALALPLIAFTIVFAFMQGLDVAMSNVLALIVLTGAMTLLMVPLTFIGSVAGQAALGAVALAAMALPLIAFTYTLGQMQNIQNALANAQILILLAGAMTLLLIPLTAIGFAIGPALLGVVALSAMTLPLLAFVAVLAKAENLQNAMTNVQALVVLATAMTLLLLPLTLIGALAIPALAGVLALTAMAVPLLAFIGVLSLMENLQNAITNVWALVILMNALTDMLVILAIVGPMALIGVTAMAGLEALMIATGGLAIAVGAIMEKFPALEEFLNKGIPILNQLANGLGSIIGNLVAGFAEGVADGLPSIGTKLSEFMTNATPFINGAKLVDETVSTGVGILAKAILALTAADLLSGILSFGEGGASFADLGLQLSQFIMNALPFLAAMQTIDPASLEGVGALAKAILILTAADILQGLTSWITGGVSLADFGSQLAPFGKAMMEYSKEVTGIDATAIEASAKAAESLVKVAETIPNSGGLAGLLAGENDLGDFATQLVPFGKAMMDYSKEVVGIDADAIKDSAKAAKSLVKVAEAIPNSGGLAGIFAGENDLSEFANQLVPFGEAMTAYSGKVAGIDADAIKNSVKAAKSLVKVADAIPESGGLLSKLTGENDMSAFAKKLVPFGEGLKSYSSTVAGINSESIEASAKAVKSLVKVVNSMSDIDTSGVSSFKGAMESLAKTNVKGFVSAFSGSTSNLSSVGGDMMGAIVKGVRGKQSSLTSTGTTIVNAFVKSIRSRFGTINASGIELMRRFISGIQRQQSQVRTAAVSGIASAVSGIRANYMSFYNAGTYLGSGLVLGILSKKQAAYNAGYAIGKASADGVEDGEKAASPSKRGIQAGEWLGEGVVIGILSMVKSVYKAGYGIGDKATQALSAAMSKVGDVISGDMDMQPTISPVLDLSGVKRGADAIGNLFNDKAMVGVTANVESVSSMMNQRSQNGDVVSAINKLRKDLSGNIGNTTYQVNGVTYDDGSNISDAVKSLVRAAKVERRI